jgi:hypothetical protein
MQKDSTGRVAQTARLSLQVDAAKVGEAHPWLEGLDWGQRKQARTLTLAPYQPRRLACINRESFVVLLAGQLAVIHHLLKCTSQFTSVAQCGFNVTELVRW